MAFCELREDEATTRQANIGHREKLDALRTMQREDEVPGASVPGAT